jgi:hypothetical protein
MGLEHFGDKHFPEMLDQAVTDVLPMPNHAPYTPPAAGTKMLDLFGNPVPAGQPIGRHVIYLLARPRPATSPTGPIR